MAVIAGARLGAYEVRSLLGVGGMGEVYRALDTKLGREVALKILPQLFAADPDRLARFQREAQVLASLNHPNIAQIYGLEETAGVRALVLELVEGPTLADRIARGPMPLEETLPIAKQIAEALEVAHEAGIIHRDLKPANIILKSAAAHASTSGRTTPLAGGPPPTSSVHVAPSVATSLHAGGDVVVKVLDFGLAKALEPPAGVSGEVTASPTITSPAMTRMGVILGTAAYMSPEQARGRAADKRSDVWAFGCALYEMLSGRRAFAGDDMTDTLAFIITKDVDWTALPANTPAGIRRVIGKCLEKDPRRRLHDIADARIEIEDAMAAPSAATQETIAPRAPASALSRALPWTIAGVAAAAAAIAIGWWAPWRKPSPSEPLRMSVELGANVSLVSNVGAAAILSPDGRMLVFAGARTEPRSSQLYFRRLNQLAAAPLAGTENASSPFFSPDGQWVAFFADGKLKKVSITGGSPITLCEAQQGRGGTWSEDDTITFSPNNTNRVTLMKVPSAGGKPEALTTLEPGEVTHRWPQVLPGGRALLYTAAASTTQWEDANIVVQPLPAGARKVVQRGGYSGRYLPSGHLVYIHSGTLFAAPFDLSRLEIAGPPVPAVEGVTSSPDVTGGAQFSFSSNGTFVFLPGQNRSSEVPISWMDRTGKATPLRSMPSNWSNPEFAPDGRRLAVDISDGKQSDVWVYEWERDTLSRLTFDQADDQRPVWTSDGRRIVFASKRADNATFNLYWQRADGTGDVQRLTESKNNQFPGAWHPSGKFLVFFEQILQGSADLTVLPMDGDEATGWKPGKPTVFLNAPFNESTPKLSPDGRWIAYISNESGRNEIYVRPFPGPGGKWQISSGGGDDPTWSRARREFFFVTPSTQIMVTPYSVDGESFRAEKPQVWSEGRFLPRPRAPSRDLDLHPAGDRFALAFDQRGGVETKQDHVVFIFNFFDELRRLAPVTKR